MRIEQNLIGRTDELQIYSAAWFDSLVEEEGFEPSVPRKRGDDFSRTRSTSPPASLAVQAIRLKSLCATASHASGETGSTYGIAVFFPREMSEWPAMPRPTHESQIAGELSSAP